MKEETEKKQPEEEKVPCKYGVTDQMITGWKNKYGSVSRVNIPDHDAYCYVRKPTRQDLSLAEKASQTDSMKYNEVMIANLWLGGDTRFKEGDEQWRFARDAGDALFLLIKRKDSELKEL